MIWTPANSSASFSPCRRYRYTLTRVLRPKSLVPCIAFIGLNPSTADEHSDDPTIRRCWKFAERWGFAEMIMLNLFAYRATDPGEMKASADPVGDANDAAIVRIASNPDVTRIVVAWGVHGVHRGRGAKVLASLSAVAGPKLHCLGRTKDGHPRHPLYLSNDVQLEGW